MKVLRQEGKKKVKFSKAKTFINKLTDHRCEERRRVSILHSTGNFYNYALLPLVQLFGQSCRICRSVHGNHKSPK